MSASGRKRKADEPSTSGSSLSIIPAVHLLATTLAAAASARPRADGKPPPLDDINHAHRQRIAGADAWHAPSDPAFCPANVAYTFADWSAVAAGSVGTAPWIPPEHWDGVRAAGSCAHCSFSARSTTSTELGSGLRTAALGALPPPEMRDYGEDDRDPSTYNSFVAAVEDEGEAAGVGGSQRVNHAPSMRHMKPLQPIARDYEELGRMRARLTDGATLCDRCPKVARVACRECCLDGWSAGCVLCEEHDREAHSHLASCFHTRYVRDGPTASVTEAAPPAAPTEATPPVAPTEAAPPAAPPVLSTNEFMQDDQSIACQGELSAQPRSYLLTCTQPLFRAKPHVRPSRHSLHR